ncbi:hypothetical protein GCM10009020_02470 [Natronoarchaeum mannanilyticum]|uniref:Uncharacterized protein n=1 Tax=Natronoarchaeum mannanilyticum TaxID=926360 RepID=A0AAV3T5N9_9EURY
MAVASFELAPRSGVSGADIGKRRGNVDAAVRRDAALEPAIPGDNTRPLGSCVMIMGNLLGVAGLLRYEMATRTPPSDDRREDGPSVGMAHPTVVPVNFDPEATDDEE